MPTDQETFGAMTKTVQEFFPKYQVKAKKDVWLHRAIGKVLKPINPNYMKSYWTFFASQNCYPTDDFPGQHYRSWRVHIHEGTHAGQEKKWSTFLWGSLYLLGTPVYTVVGFLLAIPLLVVGLLTAMPWWVSLIVLGVGVLLSIPVPFSYWRSRWELQGYGTSIASAYWCGGADAVKDDYIERKVRTFSGGEYFYMNVFKGRVRKKLKKAREMAINGTFITQWKPRYSKFYAACYQTLKDQGRVKV